jgi:hypothetical protein
MKKILALVLCFVLLASISAFAEEAPAPIKIGQVDAAPHGKGCFAVVTAVVQGDVILAAKIDEFQFVSSSETIEAVGVPNSDGSFGENYPEGKVLGSKRANNSLYSVNMQRAGSTVQIAANYNAIEAYVAGKTIAELEAATAEADAAAFVDTVSGATLADSLGYVKAVIEAAKAANDQVGTYTIYNKTGETVTELYITDNVTGEKSVNYAVNGFAADAVNTITCSLPEGEDGNRRLTLSFKTEGGYEGTFETLSIEVAPITLLAEDAKTGATAISFFAPAE